MSDVLMLNDIFIKSFSHKKGLLYFVVADSGPSPSVQQLIYLQKNVFYLNSILT